MELSIKPTPEIGLYTLWGLLYSKIHLVLVKNKNKDCEINYAVSFPEYQTESNILGSKLRIFAYSTEELKGLRLEQELEKLSEYIYLTDILDIPKNPSSHSIYRRVQFKTSIERLARRRVRKIPGITLDEAIQELNNLKTTKTNLPYIQMKSLSSNQTFSLFIEKITADRIITEKFNSYGLSIGGTVPEF